MRTERARMRHERRAIRRLDRCLCRGSNGVTESTPR
jgi:hypothetical protein